MKFYSTNKKSPLVELAEATMNGIAPDGGLYMPQFIPKLSDKLFKQSYAITFQDVAFEAGKNLFTSDISSDSLRTIINESFNFEVPLLELDDDIRALELFHGPTFAFKDFGTRFMARLLEHFVLQNQKEITVLVATSGDTGSAVASGFFGVKGVRVVILYPSGKVSGLQEKQLTTMGGNITALEVDGTFDDCQKMAKLAFLDEEIKRKTIITSANSINIARLLSQSFYYVYLGVLLSGKNLPIVVSVPSGNFGNLTAGLIAKRMGAPIYKFVAATNSNNIVPRYLKTGNFEPKSSVCTISNAMDVGSPSNFARMLELYNNSVEKMRKDIYGVNFSDEQTKGAIVEVFNKHHYIMDPHGAVAYLGLCDYLKNFSDESFGVFLETAHPAKFSDVVEKIIGVTTPMPDGLKAYLNREKRSILIKNEFSELKEFLLA